MLTPEARNQKAFDAIFDQLTPEQRELLCRIYVNAESERSARRSMRLSGMQFQAIKAEAERRFEQIADARLAPPGPTSHPSSRSPVRVTG